MRILLCVDDSDGSNDAARLVASMTWPTSSVAHLMSVVDPGAWIPPAPDVPQGGGLVEERDVAAYYEARQLAIRSDLEAAGLAVESAITRGRPADAILDDARRVEADLVVVGSRGHGKIATLLLGSVSAALVDRATCPVLVARRTSLRTALLAVDGSTSARHAAEVVASWPAFDDVPISVVAVADPVRPWTVGVAPAFLVQAHEGYAQEAHTAASEAQEISADAVSALTNAGRSATADVRSGQVADQIVTAATERDADMVVIGCRGRSGLATFLLGSVARDVVLASTASVLTVRDATGGG